MRQWTVGSLAIIYKVWGTNFVAVDIAVDQLAPATMTGIRFTIAGAVLLPISRRYGRVGGASCSS